MNTSSEPRPGKPWVFVKLGGSLITDKRRPERVRDEVLSRLAAELAEAARGRQRRLLVGHGSGSFGHMAAARHGLETGRGTESTAAIAEIQDAAARLHRLVVAALLAAGAAPFSLAPGSIAVADRGRPVLTAGEQIALAEARGLLPVVYGDIVCDRAGGASILSTEAIFQALAMWLASHGQQVSEVLWLGETEGVYDEAGRVIGLLDVDQALDLAGSVAGASGPDVTGGMRQRLRAAAEMARAGVVSRILDGRNAGCLRVALESGAGGGTVVVFRRTGP